MLKRLAWPGTGLCLVALLLSAAAPAPPSAEKILVLDGSAVHDVGNVGLNVTNWGLLGSRPGVGATYSDAPSMEWPMGSGVEYLWSGGLWVGARVGSETRVSTGQYATEILADPDDPLDTIYSQRAGQAGGLRYPSPGFDDDGDGLDGEDPVNGLDDDGDGSIDEDASGIADQHFRAVMRDDTALAQDIYPDHAPLGIEVVQESFQWTRPTVDDFVGLRFTITNVGPDPLEDVYVGFFADPDVGPRGGSNIAADDLVESYLRVIPVSDGTTVDLQLAGAYDADGDAGASPGHFAIQLLGHPVDPTGANAPAQFGYHGVQFFAGNRPFAQGGDPNNDAERYQTLASNTFDTPPPPGDQSRANDYRVLVSTGPFASLTPGVSVQIDLALVMGEGLAGLVENAKSAAVAYRGAWFDRDGDPSNGDEFHVPWYVGKETPVPVQFGDLEVAVADAEVALRVRASSTLEGLRVVRAAGDGIDAREWDAHGATIRFLQAGEIEWDLVDDERFAEPSRYRLEATQGGQTTVLDRVQVPGLGNGRLELLAYPSPFNPRLNVRFSLPETGEVAVELHDARGRLVRHLVAERRLAGVHEVVWDGLDDQARPAASGVYFVRVRAGGRALTERAVLVR